MVIGLSPVWSSMVVSKLDEVSIEFRRGDAMA
jgi:hypothetical protein